MTGPYPLPVLLEMLREPCGNDDCGHCAIERQSADEIERLQLENEVLNQRLVACDVISLSNTPETFRANRLCQEHPAWSAAYVSVCDAIEREMGLRSDVERLNQILRDVINAAESAGWNGVENSKLLTGFIAGMKTEIERLRTILSTPPTWLCPDCRNQWIMRDEAEKQPAPVFTDNRGAIPLPPRQGPNGQLKCPGQNCANILNSHTPVRCPDCLQPIEKPK